VPEPQRDALFLPAGTASVQRCARCGAITPELDSTAECARCGGLFEIVHATPDAHGAALFALFGLRSGMKPTSEPSGVWRYRELVMPSAKEPVSHPEGNTPLLARRTVQAFADSASLLLKHEGHNPTGSFKDRGMTVAVTQAGRIGARAVACASTGNTSASLAAYAAHAGIPALVFVPRGQIALGKLAQSLAYGARTLLVDGDFDTCLRLARDASRELGVYLVNSINPWRVEGQKTIVFEMLQQLGYDAPDWIALPAGNLGNISAFGKALREAFALGLITRVPRLLAVQAAGAAPFASSFAKHFSTHEPVHAETLATAIKIGDPASWDRAVRAITETNGVVTSATDAEILDAKAVIDASGVGCEPASAASVAGVRQLRDRGVIGEHERVVAVLTGHVLKDPGIIQYYHQEMEPRPARANRPIEIRATLADVERVLPSDERGVRGDLAKSDA
jgi:threonine synthase